MGADVVYIPGELAVHEPIEDVSHYLDNWFSMLVIRCRHYEDLKRVAEDSKIRNSSRPTARGIAIQAGRIGQ